MKQRVYLLVTLVLLSLNVPAEDLDIKLTASKIIDLTQPMYEGMSYWPGGVPFRMERLVDYPEGYRLHKFTMGENTGTHVDAPAHFIKGNQSIDEIPLGKLVVPIVMIDVQNQAGVDPDYQLTASDVEAWEANHGKIESNSLVIMNTGWHKKFSKPEQYINMDDEGVMHFPGYSPAAAQLLVERDVAGIGIDTLSIDYGKAGDLATHKIILNENKYQIENMGNLDALPPRGSVAVIGVLPVRGGSQAQARIFALLP